jgi:hypothetical protein
LESQAAKKFAQASLKRSFVLKPKGPERQQQDGRPEKRNRLL